MSARARSRRGLAAVLATALAWVVAGAALAGEVSIPLAEAVAEGDGRYTFHVTISHDDEGWDHYVDRWEVVAPDGMVLGTRELLHPHVTEQPFTRPLEGVAVPDGIASVTIRAHDTVHGDFEGDLPVKLPDR
jgi:hypothetical protein